jgi:spore coat polysaccharide biosynthesis protein SpsF
MNIIIIPTRLDSSRLPEKASITIAGQSLLDWVITGAEHSRNSSIICLATTNDIKDIEFIEQYKEKAFTFSWDGDKNNVLGRFCAAVDFVENEVEEEVENIVRLTHDCPLLAFYPHLIDEMIDIHLENKNDYTHNRGKHGYPSGLDVEIIERDILFEINDESNTEEREHVTLYVKNNPDKFKIGEIDAPFRDMFDLKWSIDDYDDLRRVGDIIKMNILRDWHE